MTNVYLRLKIYHSDLYFVDLFFLYIKKWPRPGVFVPHLALALVSQILKTGLCNTLCF